MKRNEHKIKKETRKEAESTLKKLQDDKKYSSTYNVSTPSPFVSKTAADIYGRTNKSSVHAPKAPKKLLSAQPKSTNVSPIKDFLKSSPSSISQDVKGRKEDAKSLHSARQTPRSTKNLPLSSVTVNSPVIKRKLNLQEVVHKKDLEKAKTSSSKDIKADNSKKIDGGKSNKEVSKPKEPNKIETVQMESSKEIFERQRSKTRTLNENEVKVLTAEMVDNNVEMLNLSRKLTAESKAFYIDLDDEKSKSKIEKTSDEEVSYEDDFESYESDFDSYRSETDCDKSGDGDEGTGNGNTIDNNIDVAQTDEAVDQGAKEIRDEEKMLDSGSYDLRDRSAKSKPSVMENILEDAEDLNDKKVSLTDEGFQEMSSSSAVSSMKTVNVDVLDRPLFIDFTKSKRNKRRKLIFERLKQRANDLLSVISLHEMSYSLFEMKPVAYDVYMATFGRNNYTQASVQTNDDSVAVETQSDEILLSHKWTQYPVEFSKHCTHLYEDVYSRKYTRTNVDYISKFNYLLHKSDADIHNDKINLDEDYRRDPLRIYLEQKDGVGASEMLPYEKYKTKLKIKDYNSERLKRVLKKFESRISSILSFNSGNTVFTDLVKSTKVPFSKGYITIPCNPYINNFKYLNNSKITQAFFSESLSNLLMTVHRLKVIEKKCLVCLWDISVANQEPLKILIAIDDILIGRFRGNSDGIVVAALDDGAIHFWDLSEEPTWHNSDANVKDSTNLVEFNTGDLTEFENDREWNSKNSQAETDAFDITCALHACSYTSSANVMIDGEDVDRIVGLELTSQDTITQEGGRKIVGQAISLQRTGILTTWSIIQERSKNPSKDPGKAYWSKMILEKSQSISLSTYVHLPIEDNGKALESFNLTAAKKRISNRQIERREVKRTVSRPRSAMSSEFEFDRPSSVSSVKGAKGAKVLQAKKNIKGWEDAVICSNLKILNVGDCDNILVAKDRGEVLCCRKTLGVMKVHKIYIASDTSFITSLEVSPHGLPYFLAATDSGTVNLCSALENRVLLILDCRNIPAAVETTEKYKSDHKGRFMSSVTKRTSDINGTEITLKMSVKNILWSPVNPCCIYAVLCDGTLLAWDLTNSDIYGKCGGQNAIALTAGSSAFSLLTPDGEVQIHRFDEEQRTKEKLNLFEKYVSLL